MFEKKKQILGMSLLHLVFEVFDGVFHSHLLLLEDFFHQRTHQTFLVLFVLILIPMLWPFFVATAGGIHNSLLQDWRYTKK